MPGPIKATKWPIDKLHGHFGREKLAILGREMRFDAEKIDVQRRHCPLLVAEPEFSLGAPGQEFGVTLHIVDQRKHFGRCMFNEDGFLDERHKSKMCAGIAQGLLECAILAKSSALYALFGSIPIQHEHRFQ